MEGRKTRAPGKSHRNGIPSMRLHCIREVWAADKGDGDRFPGPVEVDGTVIGRKFKNMPATCATPGVKSRTSARPSW